MPASDWTLLVEPDGRSGRDNMAADQALLDAAAHTGKSLLRIYTWSPPCLSLGRNEPSARYDHAAIARLGLDVVRRPTGGRAVWHDREVTYAAAAPLARFGSLRDSFTAIHQLLGVALRRLGVDASLAPRPKALSPLSAGACFGATVGGEIVVSGRKLVGSAQLRQGGTFLQHGSVLLAGSQDVVSAVSRAPSPVSNHTTLSAELGRAVTFGEVADAIAAAFRTGAAKVELQS